MNPVSQFLTSLKLEELVEGRWRLTAPLVYWSALNGRIEVPTGFETDLESVPRWLPLAYATLYGSAHAAGVLHDWLYTTALYPRQKADAILYEAICAHGEPRWKAWAIWAGVRSGGWVAWNHHRKVTPG